MLLVQPCFNPVVLGGGCHCSSLCLHNESICGWLQSAPGVNVPVTDLCQNPHLYPLIGELSCFKHSHQTARECRCSVAAPHHEPRPRAVCSILTSACRGALVVVPLAQGSKLRFGEPKNLPLVTGLVRSRAGTWPAIYLIPKSKTLAALCCCLYSETCLDDLFVPFTNIY